MMEDIRPEEKSPLLLYMVEADGEVSKNNKRVHFDKGRLYEISSGATAIFTEFPNYISPCWITTLFSTLIFLMMLLLTISTMNSSNSLRVPRCTRSVSENLDNKTIHLVHQLDGWTQDQLKLLEQIKNEYKGFSIHLVLLRPTLFKSNNITKQPANISQTITPISKVTVKMRQVSIENKNNKNISKNFKNLKRKRRDQNSPMGIGFGVKNLLDILLRSRLDSGRIVKKNVKNTELLSNLFNITEPLAITTSKPRKKTLDDIINDYPDLDIQNITFAEAFKNSPLQNSWYKLNTDLIIFAVRVIHLWQYGGLSFKMDGNLNEGEWQSDRNHFTVATESTLQTIEPKAMQILTLGPPPNQNRLLNFILEGKNTFNNLQREVVTADDEGLHIFTKTPCHVFFGEMLINLKWARGDETPKNIIQKSLKVFCKHAAVGNNYCRNFIKTSVGVL